MTDEPIVSTKEKPGAYDAFETAAPDEPIFVLKGKDPHAPATIEFWADLERRAGRNEPDPSQYEHIMRKATNAEAVAWAFRSYQRGEVEEKASEQQRFATEDITDRNIILARGVDRLHNSIAETLEFADKLQQMDEFPKERGRLRAAAEMLRAATKALEPRRQRQARS